MSFKLIDGYLLGDSSTAKADVIAAVLAERGGPQAAEPFYRGLAAVGARAADEALIALRLVLAEKAPTDDAVREVRALAKAVRAARGTAEEAAAREAYASAVLR